jgi:hypothetical protein
MRRVLISILCLCATGCSWFVPSAVKREAAMMRVNVEVALDEVRAQPDSPTKATAIRALERLEPHVRNWDCYVRGQKAERPAVTK